MSPSDKALESVHDLITELEYVIESIEDERYDIAKDELKNQSGTIATILEAWNE